MEMVRALIHRYDNRDDILAIEANRCSDVYRRSADDDFELVVVVPTNKARTDLAVVADAKSTQYRAPVSKNWPGRPDAYPWRVDVDNVRYSSLAVVKRAFENAGEPWIAAWTVRTALLAKEDLLGSD